MISEGQVKEKISIHAPIVGCDMVFIVKVLKSMEFQSTHPSWGATNQTKKRTSHMEISIHAPIVGCDEEM